MCLPALLSLFHLLNIVHADHILPTSPFIQWRGRVRRTLTTASFDYPGVTLRTALINATSLTLSLTMPPFQATRLSVFSNGTLVDAIHASSVTSNYTIAFPTLDSYRDIEIVNEVEASLIRGAGSTWGDAWDASAPTVTFVSTDGRFAQPSPPFSRKIMLVGDSLTSGFGVNGTAPCSATAATAAHSLTYGATLCSYFGAECLATVAWAGKGLLKNSPSSATGPPLPAYLKQTLGTSAFFPGNPDWDFNRPSRPDVIIINLLTNDCGVGGVDCTTNATFSGLLVQAYIRLCDTLIHTYFSGLPTLFLASGPINRAPEPLVLAVIAGAASQRNLTLHYLNFTGAPLTGCSGHPGVEGHAAMARVAVEGISAVMGWGPGGEREAGWDGEEVWGDASSSSSSSSIVRTSSEGASEIKGGGEESSRRQQQPIFTPPPNAVVLTVRSDGTGNYSSIATALTECCLAGERGGESRPVTLYLQGVFRERVVIGGGFLGGVTLIGDSPPTPSTSSSSFPPFLPPTLIISNASGASAPFWTFNTHTLLVAAPEVTLINLTVANNAGGYGREGLPSPGQSVALHLDPTSDRFSAIGCAFLGGVDTVYTGSPGYGLRSYFEGGFINGSGDAIFGGSSTVFQSVSIDMLFTVTAPRGENGSSAYLFLDSTITAVGVGAGGKEEEEEEEKQEVGWVGGSNGTTGTTGNSLLLLGRPWGQDSTVVFKSCTLGQGIGAPGWDDWGEQCGEGSHWCDPLTFAEFNSTGPGADPGGRVAWSKQLTAGQAEEWTRDRVLRGWVPPLSKRERK